MNTTNEPDETPHPELCPECNSQGFTVRPCWPDGEPEQVQCRSCYERNLPESPQPEPQQSAVEWVRERLISITTDSSYPPDNYLSDDDALELAARCDAAEEERANAVITRDQWSKEVDALTEQLAAERAKVSTLPSLVASLNELQAEVIQTKAQLGAAQDEVARLREVFQTLFKLGTGPCGGGGALDS